VIRNKYQSNHQSRITNHAFGAQLRGDLLLAWAAGSHCISGSLWTATSLLFPVIASCEANFSTQGKSASI